jgi:hypothetical protein
MKTQGISPIRKPERDGLVKRADSGNRDKIARAQRYEIGTIMRFRIRGEKDWQEGEIRNISNSGVLIRTTAHSLLPDTVIEMRFALPIQLRGEFAAEVLCRGSVVRFQQSEVPGEAGAVAARISHSRFLRQKYGDEDSQKIRSIEKTRRID